MKLLLYYLASVFIAIVTSALDIGISYPMQIIFFALVLLIIALLVKWFMEGWRGRRAGKQVRAVS